MRPWHRALSSLWGEFLSWWLGELRDLARQVMIKRHVNVPTIRITGSKFVFIKSHSPAQDGNYLHYISFEEFISSISRDDMKFLQENGIQLVFYGDLTLSRRESVPREAGKGLSDIAALIVERGFPLQAEFLVWGASIAAPKEASEDETLSLDVVAVRRSDFEKITNMLSGAQIPIRRIGVEHEDGRIISIGHRISTRTWNRLTVLSLVSAFLLLSSAGVIDLVRTLKYRNDLKNELAELQITTRHVAVLRDALESRRRERDAIAESLARTSVLSVIEELSRLMPSDTWVQGLAIEGNQATLAGFSMNPARLVEILDSSLLFEKVQLGKVAAEAGSSRRRFQIQLSIVETRNETGNSSKVPQ